MIYVYAHTGLYLQAVTLYFAKSTTESTVFWFYIYSRFSPRLVLYGPIVFIIVSDIKALSKANGVN